MIPITPSAEERQQIRDAVAGLQDKDRHREAARLRSQILRTNPKYRAADNARNAARGRETYANIEEGRREVSFPLHTK